MNIYVQIVSKKFSVMPVNIKNTQNLIKFVQK